MKLKNIGLIAWAVVTLAMWAMVQTLHTRVYRAELAKDSVEAATSKTVAAVIGDLQVAQRRIVQTEHLNDSLSKALKTSTRVRAALQLQIDSLKASVSTPIVTTGDSILTMKFPEVRKPPFTVNATVVANTIQNIAQLDFTAKIDPFKVGLDIGCGAENNNVRPATVTLTTPKFVTVSVDSVKQSREVCSPRPATAISMGRNIKTDAKLLGVGAVLGAVAHWFFNRGDK